MYLKITPYANIAKAKRMEHMACKSDDDYKQKRIKISCALSQYFLPPKEIRGAKKSTEENEKQHPKEEDDIRTLEVELADSGDVESSFEQQFEEEILKGQILNWNTVSFIIKRKLRNIRKKVAIKKV